MPQFRVSRVVCGALVVQSFRAGGIFNFGGNLKFRVFLNFFEICKQTTLRYRASAACKGHDEFEFRFSEQYQAHPVFGSSKLTLCVAIKFSKYFSR